MKFNNIKAIIFDFDGVIAESVNVKTEAFSKIYAQYGSDIGEKVVEYHLSHGGISRFEKFKFYHKEYLGIELTNHELKELGNKFSELVMQKVINAPYVPGALEFIQENECYDLFISSGTPEFELIEIIKRKKIDIYFKSIHGAPENKTNHVKNIISQNDYGKDEIIFIGDADTDIIAAKQNDIPIILRVHPSSNCNYNYHKTIKVDNLTDLIDIVELGIIF